MSHSERASPSRIPLVKTYGSRVGAPALGLLVLLQFGALLTSNASPADSTTAIGGAASQTQTAVAAAASRNPDLQLPLAQIVVRSRVEGTILARRDRA